MRLTEADIDAIEQAIEQNVPLSLMREGGMVLLDDTTISFHGLYAYEYQADYISEIRTGRIPCWYRCYIRENTSLTPETMPRNTRYQRTLATWNEQNIQRQQAAAERRAAQEPVEQPVAPPTPSTSLVDRAREFVRGLYRPIADEVPMGTPPTINVEENRFAGYAMPTDPSYTATAERLPAANTGIEAPTGNISFRLGNSAATTLLVNGAEVRLPFNPLPGHTVIDSRNTYSYTYAGDGNWRFASIPQVQTASPSTVAEGEAAPITIETRTSTPGQRDGYEWHTISTDAVHPSAESVRAYSGRGLREQIHPYNAYAYDGSGVRHSLQSAYLEQPQQMDAAVQYAFGGHTGTQTTSNSYFISGGYNEDREIFKWFGGDPISPPAPPKEEPPMCDLFLP